MCVRVICINGHLVNFHRNPRKVTEAYWDASSQTLLGRVTHVNLYNFKIRTWTVVKLQNNSIVYTQRYKVQEARKKYQVKRARLTWLLCALRLGICKDVRTLIGKYLNYEPFEFWRE